MKKTILLVACFTVAAFGQFPTPDAVSRVFQLKYADANQVGVALGVFPASNVQIERNMKLIAVRATAPVMAEIENVIKRFDVPPTPTPNIEVTIYVLSADQTSSNTLPKELDSVAKQLTRIFAYKGLRLLDTQVIRTRAGDSGEVSGVVDGGGQQSPNARTVSQFKFQRASVQTDDKGRVVRLDNLRLGLKVPIVSGPAGAIQYMDVGVSTNVDVREGQKVVVGKTNPESPDKAAVYVVSATIVE